MIKLLLAGWFLVKAFSIDSGTYEYYLHDQKRGIHVAVHSKVKLDIKENEQVKIKISAECEKIEVWNNSNHIEQEYFCNAETVHIIQPTNCFWVNGMCYY